MNISQINLGKKIKIMDDAERLTGEIEQYIVDLSPTVLGEYIPSIKPETRLLIRAIVTVMLRNK